MLNGSKYSYVSLTFQTSVICFQTVLFLIIQFSTSHLFTLSLNVKQVYLTQNGPGSDGNEGVLHIPQSLTIKLFSVISRIPVFGEGGLTPLQRCSQRILQLQLAGLYSCCIGGSSFVRREMNRFSISGRKNRYMVMKNTHVLFQVLSPTDQ